MKYGAVTLRDTSAALEPAIANKKLKVVLVFLLMGMSVMPILKQNWVAYALLAPAVLFIRKVQVDGKAVLFLLFAFLLELLHVFIFPDYNTADTKIGMFTMLAAVLYVYYIKLDFLEIYLRQLYVFTLISFVFFGLYYVSSDAVQKLADSIPAFFIKTSVNNGVEAKQIDPIFYNFDRNYLTFGRNNGPFWEPTIFCIMLIVGQMFNLLQTKKLFNRRGIVFTIGILTTMSTTGFMAYFVFLLFYFLLSFKTHFLVKVLLIAGLLGGGVGLYTNLSFLNEKVLNEIDKADYEMDKYGGDSRLASAILDLREVSEEQLYIFTGRGLDANYRIDGPSKDVLRNCGVTSLLAQWGIIFWLFYFGLMFFSWRGLTRHYDIPRGYAWAFLVIFLILGFSEVIFVLPFFYALLFLGFTAKKEKKDKSPAWNGH